jgi:HSP20 family protein
MNRATREITQTSPRYEVTDDDEKFQLAIDVPGMTSKDITIAIEGDGKFLTIEGTRESASDTYRVTSKFSQCFSTDPSVEIDKFSASPENGVLVVSAPKDLKKIEERVRTKFGKFARKDEPQKKVKKREPNHC